MSTFVYSDIPEKAQFSERLYKRLLNLANEAYDHPSSMLESVFGALSLLLKTGYEVSSGSPTILSGLSGRREARL